MLALILATALAAPFPLPAIDGKALAVKEGQKTFRLPTRFEKVRAFYEKELKGPVLYDLAGWPGQRKLTIHNRGKGDSWARAIITEGELETVIEVVPVLRLAEEQIEGQGKPLVEFVFGRSPEVQKSLDSLSDPLGR